ncbi:MAG TPA: NnrS family protein, partial [Chloroflexota bacterium]|nr:NnrS family protein [Chloroflexota bacterium]
NLVLCIELAQGGVVVAFTQDEALLHLELWGFAATMVLAVSGRVFPRFLLLQPTRERLVRAALLCWASGTFGVSIIWLVLDGAAAARLVVSLAQLLGAALFVSGVRLYEAPLRASGMPQVTNPTRTWARLAFAFLLTAAAANVGIAAAELLGRTTTLMQVSAARHLLAQGFLLPIIVLMAARILPGYSGHMLHRPRLLAGLVWSLLLGAGLRGMAELIGGYANGWGPMVGIGGTLAVAAFVVFAIGLWRAIDRAPSPAGAG